MFTFDCNKKCVELISGADVQIRFMADSATGSTTITKEVHRNSVVDQVTANDVLEVGMTIETVLTYTATGNWDDRYTLEYTQV